MKQVDGTQCTAIHNQEAKTFGYDECFWSHDKVGSFFGPMYNAVYLGIRR